MCFAIVSWRSAMEDYRKEIIDIIEKIDNTELIKFVYGILKGAENEKKED